MAFELQAAILADRGRVLPSDVDLVVLVGGGYILGYLGWHAAKLVTSDGRNPQIDANSEKYRRRAGIALGIAAIVYAAIRSGAAASVPFLHKPLALLNVVAAFAVGNFTGAATGVVAAIVRRDGSKEHSTGSYQALFQGVLLAVMFVVAWLAAGRGPAQQSLRAGCSPDRSAYSRNLSSTHHQQAVFDCKR